VKFGVSVFVETIFMGVSVGKGFLGSVGKYIHLHIIVFNSVSAIDFILFTSY
jgi:hypothetical protein